MTRRFTQLEDLEQYLPFYEVLADGRVWSKPRITYPKKLHSQRRLYGRWTKTRISTNGYVAIDIRDQYNNKKTIMLHRLVALVFLGDPPQSNYDVNHKDGNKLNNSKDNLEWVTRSENQLHAYSTGVRTDVGENNHNSIISNAKAISIFILRNHFELPLQQIANMYQIGFRSVSRIAKCGHYAVKGREHEVKTFTHEPLSYEEANAIFDQFHYENKKGRYLSKKYKVNKSIISRVTCGHHRYTTHRKRIKTNTKGENNGFATLTNDQAKLIFTLRNDFGLDIPYIAQVFNCSASRASAIANGKHSAVKGIHFTPFTRKDKSGHKNPIGKLTYKDRIELKRLRDEEKLTYFQLGDRFNITFQSAQRIYKKPLPPKTTFKNPYGSLKQQLERYLYYAKQ
jgi:hypothetical protein